MICNYKRVVIMLLSATQASFPRHSHRPRHRPSTPTHFRALLPRGSVSPPNPTADFHDTCIIEVAAWMARNDLTLNAEKSQAILFQPLKHGVNKQPEVCVEVAGRRIALSTSVRNIGVVFDSRLSMEELVAQTAKSCYYQLRNIGQIRSSITEGACRTLVHTLVTSRLDYGNGLLYGIPQATLQRLQRIQNCAARLITRTRKYEHITPVLRRFHWLPVRQRTLYTLLVLTYCAVNDTASNYLVQLVHRRHRF